MAATRERPILFSAEMVRAILDGSKTQTRRVVPRPVVSDGVLEGWRDRHGNLNAALRCPYGVTGDRLWVRETWAVESVLDYHSPSQIECGVPVWHCADFDRPNDNGVPLAWGKTRPSIYMPRWASRITLEVESVRVERVQDISEADVLAEGYEKRPEGWTKACWASNLAKSHPQDAFAYSWNQLNTKRGYGWDKNPWVWVVEFKRLGAHT